MAPKPRFTESDVQAVLTVWVDRFDSRDNQIDRRAVARHIRWGLQRLCWGTYGVTTDELNEAGGAGAWLLERTRLFAASDAARRQPRFRIRPRSFFDGPSPRFLDDPGDWKDQPRPEEPKMLEDHRYKAPWSSALGTWKDTVADKKARGELTPDIVNKAIGYLRRDGFDGTDGDAREMLGVSG